MMLPHCIASQASAIFCFVFKDASHAKTMQVKEMRVRKTECLNLRPIVLGILILMSGLLVRIVPATAGEMRKFTLVNVEIDKTKIWLPSSMTVNEGDEVEITLDNKLAAPHGFKLAAYDIEVVVPALNKQTVRFTANKAGVYSFICQLHAPHVGGQLVVLSAAHHD
jgi:nitrosocyanin